MGLKLYAKLLGVLFVVGLLTVGYQTYQSKSAEIKTLTAKNSELQLVVETQQDAITSAEQTVLEWEQALLELEKRNRQLEVIASEARVEQKRLNGMFEQLDVERLARDDPTGLAATINSHSDYLNCLLQQASGDGGQDCSLTTTPTP